MRFLICSLFLLLVFVCTSSNILYNDKPLNFCKSDSSNILDKAKLLTISRHNQLPVDTEIHIALSRLTETCDFKKNNIFTGILNMDSTYIRNLLDHFEFIKVYRDKYVDRELLKYSNTPFCNKCSYLIIYSYDLKKFYKILGFENCNLREFHDDLILLNNDNVLYFPLDINELLSNVFKELNFENNSIGMYKKYIQNKKSYQTINMYNICDTSCSIVVH